ncbi:MAG: TRC40/GET3/ArsA family transport-energizing ATPase [Aquificaceae bacterium]|nr:TRC40/GET3/ArsA family transport-energizing ATPase [Aquificaceae bacterium]MDW8097705.1 TRC40/GET3/ArsA family transport-energizing ATPase [Aquificaceae bacterium]
MLLKKLVFFGGKGGVGKSTLSCATALRLSERGKTLLVSVDPAHSLSGIWGVPIGETLKEIKEGLHAVEFSGEVLVEEYARRVIKAVGELVPSVRSGMEEYVRYLKHSPTALETAVLDRLAELCNEYTYVVVDSAPTGQMLRLFDTLHMVEGWFDFLYRLSRERHRVEKFMGREDKLLELIESRRRKVQTLTNILKKKTVIFAVANEETLSFQESQTLARKLKDFKVQIVLNKWRRMTWEGPLVPTVENPYGVEGLSKLEVSPLIELIGED